jgi:hypothetical protein
MVSGEKEEQTNMTFTELADKMATLLGGKDALEFRARLNEYVALHPPPLDAFRSLTAEQFDAAVERCGGPEAVRRSARAFYSLADQDCRTNTRTAAREPL